MNKMLEKFFGEDTAWTHWQWYHKFFNITVFRYLVTWFAIVPLFAKVLAKLPKEVTLGGYTLNLQLPFNWKMLWIASLLFVIAYILYQIYCPRFIKTYTSFKDYKLHQHSPRWLSWLSMEVVSDKDEVKKFIMRMLTKKYLVTLDNDSEIGIVPRVDVEEKQSILTFIYDNNVYQFSMPILSNGEEDTILTEIAEREVFWEIFGRFSSSKRLIRLIIVILLYLCGILFSIVLVQNIWAAVEYLVK